jgi:hypothetical protein
MGGGGVDPVSLTAFLAPFMPYLMKGVQDLGEEAARALSADAWKYAKAIWGKLRPKIAEQDGAQAAASVVAEHPNDDRARGALELQLESLLKSDPELAEAVEREWTEGRAANAIVVGERGVAVTGAVTNSVFVTGDDNTVIR